ncbi:MAG: PAS domain S-box protein [Candidatus Fermentibacteraceae bacterium]|nr:PAS domain S-box protein [Candidatus Fermentibacteraceae bacterium]MBN2608649.1 PAS domain S-box protein [Candidatus Fermentibacteraceae bacterium]
MNDSGTVLSYMSAEDILRDSDQLLLFISRSGKIILNNSNGGSLLGYREGEMAGMNWFDEIVSESVRNEVREGFRAALSETGEPDFIQEYPVVSADSTERAGCFHNRVMRDEDGIVMCILVSGHLQESPPEYPVELVRDAGLYRSMMKQSVHGLLVIRDDPLRIVYAGEHMGRICGYTDGELKAMAPGEIEQLIHQDSRTELLVRVREQLKGVDVSDTMEVRLNTRDGDSAWVLMRSTLMEYEEAPAIQMVCIDISMTRRTMEFLRESEEKYRTLVENSSDAIVIHRDGRIVFANRTAMEMTGYEEEELLGNSILNFVSHDFEALVLRNMTNRISGKEVPSIYNIEVLRNDGGIIPVEINVSEIHYEGDKSYMVLIRDLSERQELEGQLRQAQKMEAVGQLAGGVAHDFNNILQVINGYTELAETALEEDHPVREMIDQIAKAGERASELVRQLLLFSRNQIIVTSILDLNQIVSEHLSMLKRIIGEDIVIEFASSPEPIYVNADHSMMGQILLNICLNARDAMPGGGDIVVRTDRIYLNSEFCEMNPSAKPGYFGMLSISDSGQGMDEDTLGRIFEPFFSTKGITAGTGLGLSTVYGIVTQHDGLIKAASEPGSGATFSVYLPVADRNIEIEEIPQEYELEETASLTVVIAEDDENVRNLTCEVLSEAGHEVITAADGGEAVVLVSDSPDSVDLVILDAVMPVMNGFLAAEKIREIRPEMPIIFCSGYSREKSSESIGRFKEYSRFLLKPYSMSQLMTAMNELLSEKH